MDKKEIGGYFELELNSGQDYHDQAIKLNSARNCLKYILAAQKPKHIYIPSYCCDSLIEPIISEKINYSFYHINADLELINPPKLSKDEKIIYVNYFSLKNEYVTKIASLYREKLIIDNTQAFFEKPIHGIDTIYSPRKFFGVSDGGYLYTNIFLNENLEQDYSQQRFLHLTGRIEQSASNYYNFYKKSDESLTNQPIKRMSTITQRILKSINYNQISLIRQRNFWFLHSLMKEKNLFNIKNNDFIPMNYPFLSTESTLRNRLIDNKIYTAQYWKCALPRASPIEKDIIENITFLPIDQRYGLDEMKNIHESIN